MGAKIFAPTARIYLTGLIIKNYDHFGPSNISVIIRRTVKNFQTVNFLLAPPQPKSLGAAPVYTILSVFSRDISNYIKNNMVF